MAIWGLLERSFQDVPTDHIQLRQIFWIQQVIDKFRLLVAVPCLNEVAKF
jgi:hypothetical protein